MLITIQHIDGCLSVDEVEGRIQAALRSTDIVGDVVRVVIASQEDADRLAFVGSPTVLIDGIDPFTNARRTPALACRLYATETGFEGSPSVTQLIAALCHASTPARAMH